MLIIGAKGFAKEILAVLDQLNQINDLVFFDNKKVDTSNFVFDIFPVLRPFNEVESFFSSQRNTFALGQWQTY